MRKHLRLLQQVHAVTGAYKSSRCRSAQISIRQFNNSTRQQVIKQFLLADIGEGITECQLIQWFVQPGARVEQFDKLCEVQSDKASVEITSSYDGVIRKLHYSTDDMAITGKPLVDIDVVEDPDENQEVNAETNAKEVPNETLGTVTVKDESTRPPQHTIATPAVRHLTRELNIDISDIRGTGRDGRVLKEDVHKHVQKRARPAQPAMGTMTASNDRTTNLTPIQQQMFKAMTRSLSIPHFLYSSIVDMSRVTDLRRQLNMSEDHKITSFAIIIKAVSLALGRHAVLNASLHTTSDKPSLTYHATHNFGIAVDTSSGLVVPVIRDIQSLSIDDIAAAIQDISERGKSSKLLPADFKDATFTISNIGSIGGGVVSPVISEPQVAILGIGRSRVVPAFDEHGELCRKEELVMSWSADHRIIDGATCARCAEDVRHLLEAPGTMIREMK